MQTIRGSSRRGEHGRARSNRKRSGRLPFPDRPQSNRRRNEGRPDSIRSDGSTSRMNNGSRRGGGISSFPGEDKRFRRPESRWEAKMDILRSGGEQADRLMYQYQEGALSISSLRRNYSGPKARRNFLEMVRKSHLLNREDTATSGNDASRGIFPTNDAFYSATRTGTNVSTVLRAARSSTRAHRSARPTTSRTAAICTMLTHRLVPEVALVIKKENRPRELVLAHKGLNDVRFLAVVAAIDKMTELNGPNSGGTDFDDTVAILDASHNQLTSIGVTKLIRSTGPTIRVIDLSSNKIRGQLVCERLAD